MIKSITQGDEWVNISGGQSVMPYIRLSNNINSASQAFAGQTRWSTSSQCLEIFDGASWITCNTTNATVGVSQRASAILHWAEQKMIAEREAYDLAKEYPGVKHAIDNVKQAQEKLDLITTLIKSGSNNDNDDYGVAMSAP